MLDTESGEVDRGVTAAWEQGVDGVLVIGAGQAGLAAGAALRELGLGALIVDAADQPGGSWPRYYDSLRLFSPTRFSALPGEPLPGEPDRYPCRDEVAEYLGAYAARLDLPIRTRTRVASAVWDGEGFRATTTDGGRITARAMIVASGGFGQPVVPDIHGMGSFNGQLLHAARYRAPHPYTGQRVVVVGAGNSAVQIAVELAGVARVSLAVRHPVRFTAQRPLGIDIHYWAHWSGVEKLPLGRRAAVGVGVLDDGRYAAALAAGRPDQRPMFTAFTPTGVVWPDHGAERIDTVILATGYRPDVDYLTDTGALGSDGWPVHCRGLSLTLPRLGYVGLPGQTGIASATLRGVGPDARRVARHLRRALTDGSTRPGTCPAWAPIRDRRDGQLIDRR